MQPRGEQDDGVPHRHGHDGATVDTSAGTSQQQAGSQEPRSSARPNARPAAAWPVPRAPDAAAATSRPSVIGAPSTFDEHVGDHLIGRHPFELGLRLEHEAMAQHRQRRALHVVGQQVVAARRPRPRPWRSASGEPAARAGAERDRRPFARPPGDRRDVAEQRRLDAARRRTSRAPPPAAAGRSGRDRRASTDARRRSRSRWRGEDGLFLLPAAIGIADPDLHQENRSSSRLRQRIRAFELDRILGREHGEQRPTAARRRRRS